MIDIVVDLETLSLNTRTGAVMQIGIADSTGDFFSETIKDLRGTVDADTLKWWAGQDQELLAHLKDVPVVYSPTEILTYIGEYISAKRADNDQLRIWGNSASFDLVALASCYKRYCLPVPWNFREECCLRTVLALAPPSKSEKQAALGKVLAYSFPFNQKHNGLHDALYELELLKPRLEMFK